MNESRTRPHPAYFKKHRVVSRTPDKAQLDRQPQMAKKRWSLERIKDIALCVQSIAVAVSIPVAGYWAFGPLRQQELADLTQEKIRIENQKLGIEQGKLIIEKEKLNKELRERRIISLRIKANQTAIPDRTGKYISANIEVANTGNSPQQFYWTDCDFSVTRIGLDESDDVTLAPCVAKQVHPLRKDDLQIGVLPGEVENAFFLTRIDKPGLHEISIKLKTNQGGGTGAQSLKKDSEYWEATSYLLIE